MRENQKALFCLFLYFCGCFNCTLVRGDGVGQKVLYRPAKILFFVN